MTHVVIVDICRIERNIMLIVRYLGHPVRASLGCSDPIDLFAGRLYEVAKVRVNGGLKQYELRGLKGQLFMAHWFSRVGESYDQPQTEVWSKLIPGGDYQRLI